MYVAQALAAVANTVFMVWPLAWTKPGTQRSEVGPQPQNNAKLFLFPIIIDARKVVAFFLNVPKLRPLVLPTKVLLR